MTPEGEIYSPTSPGGSPGPSLFDDESMAGIIDNEESDLRDILSLYQVEERKAMRHHQRQIIDLVASMGGTPDPSDVSELGPLEPLLRNSTHHQECRHLPRNCRVMALHQD